MPSNNHGSNTTMVFSSIHPACALRKEQYVNIQCALELLYMTISFNCQQHFNQLWLRIKPWFYNDHSFKLCTFILWLENKQMNNETSYYNGKCTLSSHTQSKFNHGYLSRIEPWFFYTMTNHHILSLISLSFCTKNDSSTSAHL